MRCPNCGSDNVILTVEGYQCYDCFRMAGTTTTKRRECEQCGGPLVRVRNDARFCSDMCKQRWHRRQNKTTFKTECEQCGVLFDNKTMRQLYCSQACKQAAYRERKQRKAQK